jgi:hypothetical protein
VASTPDTDDRDEGLEGAIRLRSKLDRTALPADPSGAWTVDVLTEDGQLVGRVGFRITK